MVSAPSSEDEAPTLPASHPGEDMLSNKEQRTAENFGEIESSSSSASNERGSLKKLKLKERKLEKAQKLQK